jgi:predicted dehydrogenase
MLNGAIIGAGKIAQTGHLPAYYNDEIKSKINIVAAVDISKQTRQNITANFPEIKLYDNIHDLLKNEKLDFVDICVPPNNHKKTIELAVENGLHILCEKPFSHRLDEATELESLLYSKNLVFMPCHQYKYSPIWKAFKEIIMNNKSSEKSLLQFNVYRKQADPGSDAWNPAWRTNNKISGGGILADTGVHYIYLVLWMLGSVKSVTTNTYSLKHDYGVEDTALALIESEKGLAQINLTWAADKRANNARAVTNDESLWYDGNSMFRYNNDLVEKIQVPDASDKSTYIALYVSLFNEFISNIESKNYSKDSILEAYQSILTLNSCYRSANEKKTIFIDPKQWINEQK